MPLKGKHIVLGISGGIAAYKSAYLLRLLIKKGAEVQVVITPNGKEFITPATLAALSGKPVVSEFFAANTGEWHSHVDLGLWADLMIVAPATASTIGKMANGIADNMLITTYLSAKEQVMVAPAMDLDMWAHPSTQRNVKQLREDGVIIVEPQAGFLASGLMGKGRMEEPEGIVRAAEAYFAGLSVEKDLAGKKVLISAGPTYENIDPVRFIGNYSSGKMGFAIAHEAAKRGAEVVLVAGPVDPRLSIEEGVRRIDVKSAREMLSVMKQEFADADIVILAAAVADYAPAEASLTKLKREKLGDMTLKLVKNPDIAATLGSGNIRILD
ncbi:MAG: bifunctional phosphopantothenoylcysteine decarboxylase/phosphopantothenate--cysteine ligase CoaBC [Muribaculaceae bacterium]|nr:bifunctional phosphopantothenoylcysteine decarboxylase/phosphopantothenate--cysteine ligase CoaBC [Muribaculaceae bacterium]